MNASERIATFYEQADITQEEFRHLTEPVDVNPGTFTAAYLETPEGDLIPGIVMQTDYDGAQEYGLRDIREALCGKEEGRFAMLEDRVDHVATFSDHSGLVLSRYPLVDRTLAWGDLPGPSWRTRSGEVRRGDYPATLQRQARYSRNLANLIPDPELARKEDLAKRARDLGISPMPRSKVDIVAQIAAHPETARQAIDLWPIMFSPSDTLMLTTEGEGPTQATLDHLAEAASAGRLGFGNASGPFHTGLFFYDVAHETPQLIADRDKALKQYRRQMRKLGDREQRLRDAGVMVYFLGNPRDEDGQTHFWLNCSPPRPSKQVSGWVTTEQVDGLIKDPLSADRWVREQEDLLRPIKDALVARGLTVAALEPDDDLAPARGQDVLYRAALKDGDVYVYDNPSATMQDLQALTRDPDAEIRRYKTEREESTAASSKRMRAVAAKRDARNEAFERAQTAVAARRAGQVIAA